MGALWAMVMLGHEQSPNDPGGGMNTSHGGVTFVRASRAYSPLRTAISPRRGILKKTKTSPKKEENSVNTKPKLKENGVYSHLKTEEDLSSVRSKTGESSVQSHHSIDENGHDSHLKNEEDVIHLKTEPYSILRSSKTDVNGHDNHLKTENCNDSYLKEENSFTGSIPLKVDKYAKTKEKETQSKKERHTRPKRPSSSKHVCCTPADMLHITLWSPLGRRW